ncbi:Hypothetical predicted protein [Prunus dulcis]|uniref:Uncharacterized protein n=1 Tax=Prunus dulcis TaxID=3755 RepID=A0A5E4FPW1_PRUDU|nr:Hypothetical predicted protein [Prunus dulcis]
MQTFPENHRMVLGHSTVEKTTGFCYERLDLANDGPWGLAWTAYEAFNTLCCSGHYLLPHRQFVHGQALHCSRLSLSQKGAGLRGIEELGWESRAAVRNEHRPSLTVVRGSSSCQHRVCSAALTEWQWWFGSFFGGLLCSFDLGPWSVARVKVANPDTGSKLKVVGAFDSGESRLLQRQVSTRVVTALTRGLLRGLQDYLSWASKVSAMRGCKEEKEAQVGSAWPFSFDKGKLEWALGMCLKLAQELGFGTYRG